ncbi:uncharacterized protein PAC_01697 [Phialocephala subalpina]|uniref:FAD-dependent urate hydroxylase HpyO/Asp monooxygenase CreE-like FAD/NAD(P)-binding domain-containing protein n=1 Tax=Phialocephala subalpina TaxID=576137 RepID=A0A1L7WGB5_9HELO|nr:uncharacterized protein PAC_01697 [Phialocephala subalpina]
MSSSRTLLERTVNTLGHCDAAEYAGAGEQEALTKEVIDVAVIGGGVCGLAVILQLIERVKDERKEGKKQSIGSIYIIEKGGVIGTGLAYSEACTGSIIDTHASTMGPCPINPMKFVGWLQDNNPELRKVHFPTRSEYGRYLRELLKEAIVDAKALNIDFRTIHGNVINATRQNQTTEVVLADGRKLHALNVVCPWPVEKFGVIEHEAPVFIMGSRLTAIDVANALVEHGHTGKIYMISRSRRLPKVQGPPAEYPYRYQLHSLAREVEDRPVSAWIRIACEFEDEMEDYSDADFSELTRDVDPLQMLKADIAEAEKGPIRWQVVLNAMKALVERYWSVLTLDEKTQFLKENGSKWMTYRHAIPLENARKILAGLEKGQLVVLQGENVKWSGDSFNLKSNGKEYRVKYLIESLGQEYDTTHIDSPLLQSMLKSRQLAHNPLGGVDVDFNTLKATEGLYVIGSLTKGVHFYTSAIDRNVAHAARVADNIVGLPFRRPLHVALFVGTDLFSNLMVSRLVPELLGQGHLPFLILPADLIHVYPTKEPYKLAELTFWERDVLQKVVISFLGSSQVSSEFATVEQLKEKYAIMVDRIENISSPHCHSILKDNYIDLGINLRSYQEFDHVIRDHFQPRGRAIVNLEAGFLPTLRAMMNGKVAATYTLHYIDDEDSDGGIIDVQTLAIDHSQHMLWNVQNNYGKGVEMVMAAVEKLARFGSLPAGDGVSMCSSDFLTKEDLDICVETGILLEGRDRSKVKKLLVDCFSGDRKKELGAAIEVAELAWYDM